jgi:dTDP-4-amino-4,6-dideoxygalactose transaminase
MQTYESRIESQFASGFQALCFWKARVALYATLKALGLGPGDEVILPGYTCVVVANAVRFTGATPVYADIAAENYNLDPNSVEANITPQTRALIVQHTYGIPADVDRLMAIANDHKIDVIEDCAHVLVGSSYKGKHLGSFGKAGFFSSQWSKPYTTGLGGVVVTRDIELAETLNDIYYSMFSVPPLHRQFQLRFQYSMHRHLFKPSLYWFSRASLNRLSRYGLFLGSSNSTELLGKEPPDNRWRMGNLQRRTGQVAINSMKQNALHSQRLARYYETALQAHGWPLNKHLNSDELVLLRFPILVANKFQILECARSANVEIGSWFDTPLHPLSLKEHKTMGYRLSGCPVAEITAARVINLPLHSRITESDAKKVVELVLKHAIPVEVPHPLRAETTKPRDFYPTTYSLIENR